METSALKECSTAVSFIYLKFELTFLLFALGEDLCVIVGLGLLQVLHPLQLFRLVTGVHKLKEEEIGICVPQLESSNLNSVHFCFLALITF